MKTKLDPHLVAVTNGAANPKQVSTHENVRITVIAPELIRVEFNDRGDFVDKATQAIWFRDCGEWEYSVDHVGKNLIVRTEQAEFHVDTRRRCIDFVVIDGIPTPADNRDNLKGTYRTLDRTRGKVRLGQGIIGRNGVAVMEDKTLMLDTDGECKPRPKERTSTALQPVTISGPCIYTIRSPARRPWYPGMHSATGGPGTTPIPSRNIWT